MVGIQHRQIWNSRYLSHYTGKNDAGQAGASGTSSALDPGQWTMLVNVALLVTSAKGFCAVKAIGNKVNGALSSSWNSWYGDLTAKKKCLCMLVSCQPLGHSHVPCPVAASFLLPRLCSQDGQAVSTSGPRQVELLLVRHGQFLGP